jgi:hypothetical protein
MPSSSGTLVEGRLEFPFAGYAVPRSALATVGGQPGVFVERGDHLRFTAVTIGGSDREAFYVSSDADLGGAAVLSTSVSAAQGILLGLGQD